MNKHLAVWGILIFIGFIATQHLYSYSVSFIPVAWVVLVAIGFAFGKTACRCKKDKNGKRTCTCDCLSDIWVVGVLEGVVLTAAIMMEMLPISPFYILSAWLLAIGSTMVAQSLRKKHAIDMQLGAFWLFSAVFFPFVNNYQSSTFIIGAMILGIPMLIAGLVEKK
jgi:hypothetical protein